MFLLDDDFKRLGKGKHTQNFRLCKHFSEIFRKTVFIQPFWLSHCKDIHGCTKYWDEITQFVLCKGLKAKKDFFVRKIEDVPYFRYGCSSGTIIPHWLQVFVSWHCLKNLSSMYVTRGRAPISAKKRKTSEEELSDRDPALSAVVNMWRFDSKTLAFLGTANMGKFFDCTKYLSYFFMLAFIFLLYYAANIWGINSGS